MARTFQEIRNEAASTSNAARLWALNTEIGDKFKRNRDKATFASYINGQSDFAHDWFNNKAPVYSALCSEVSAMLGAALAGKSTSEIVALATITKTEVALS